MHPVAYMDLVSIIACLVAVVFLIRGYKRPGLNASSPLLLLILLGFMTYYQIALFLEWSGITTTMTRLEDFEAVFIPFIWAFVFYGFVHHIIEGDLRSSRERFKALTESTSDWIWECDADGVFTYCSPQVANLLKYEPSDMLGRTLFDYIVSAGRDRFRSKFDEAVRYKAAIWLEPVYFVARDKQLPCLELSAVPVVDRQGRVKGYRGVSRNITDRKRAEENLLAYQQKLRSLASELSLAEERERRRIATGLHDYACQNLVFSKMKLQELRSPSPKSDSDNIAGICDTLDQTLESMRGLIFDLSSPTLYKFGLEAALKELLEDKLKIQHGISYTFHDDGAKKPLAEDVRVLLFQSVRELVINIVKHAQAQMVNVDVVRTDGQVKISVVDDGVGFDAPNTMTDPSRSQGFGLFNIKERLDFIGGRLDIKSRPGQGSRFTLVARVESDTAASRESAGNPLR